MKKTELDLRYFQCLEACERDSKDKRFSTSGFRIGTAYSHKQAIVLLSKLPFLLGNPGFDDTSFGGYRWKLKQ